MSRSSVPSPWNPVAEPVALGSPDAYVMIVAGQSFCLADDNGDIHVDTPHGLFVGDLRVLSRLVLLVDELPVEPLEHHLHDASTVEYVGRSRAQHEGAGSLVVVRRRSVASGLRDEIEVRNYSALPTTARVTLLLDADFAELFAVKEHRARRRGEHHVSVLDSGVAFDWKERGAQRRVVVSTEGETADVRPGTLQWSAHIAARDTWRVQVDVALHVGVAHDPLPCDNGSPAGSRAQPAWVGRNACVSSESVRLDRAVRRSLTDLEALRLHDPAGEARPVIAAGAPWFMTLFGRDALLTAWMALPVDPALALGVLQALARHQGTDDDPASDEQPGRILHEMRWGAASTLSLGGGHVYYGTADATPLFVMLLGELVRWGGIGDDDLRALVPHADAALRWITEFGDADGDGYVEYHCPTADGLRNQGWKDSWDGVRFADGAVAEPPIALCEVQGYVHAAYLAEATIAARLGDAARASDARVRAAELRTRLSQDFVLPDGRLAFGLDGTKRRIDANVTNPGHVLWCEALDDAVVPGVVAGLTAPALWSGWGVRTMAEDQGGYDPMSYHCGSVWPHDNAIVAAGLRRAGARDAAQRIVDAQLAVAERAGGRLPELLSGLARRDIAVPVRFPTSCSPQAWAAASPLLHLRTMLGLDPDVVDGTVRVAPEVPESYGELTLEGIMIAGRPVSIRARGRECEIDGLGPSLRIVHAGRHAN